MSTKEKRDYYDSTANSAIRPDLKYAASLVGDDKIAIDCGCGAGSDIAFLRDNGFSVYAFDIEEESIRRCRDRFNADEKVTLSQASFTSFNYPNASLILADASLFFCPQAEFNKVWRSIGESLSPDGVFCGSFLGPNDTMAGPNYDKDAFWPDITVFTEGEVRKIFAGFEIIKWTEHNISGEGPQGAPHQWHVFSVVAKRIPKWKIRFVG